MNNRFEQANEGPSTHKRQASEASSTHEHTEMHECMYEHSCVQAVKHMCDSLACVTLPLSCTVHVITSIIIVTHTFCSRM